MTAPMASRAPRCRWFTVGAAVALIVTTLAGCAPATVKQTNRATDYTGTPKRLFVIAGKGMGWGPEFSDAFQQKFSEIGSQCGIVTTFEEVSGLELDLERTIANRATQFNADTVLFIAQGGGVVMMPAGNRVSIHYSATLRDIAQRRAVWRGGFEFGRGGTVITLAERGAVFAIDLSNSLKDDALMQGADCRSVPLGRGERLEQATGDAPSATPAATSSPVVHRPRPVPATAPPAPPAPPAPATAPTVSLQELGGLLPQAAANRERKAELARLQALTHGAAATDGAVSYAERIRRHVLPNVRADGPLEGNPVAVVQLELAPDGTLRAATLAKASGSTAWDTAVLRAVQRSAPFPPADNGSVPPKLSLSFRPQ
ncbi:MULTISPECIES: energy transducer TonB [unclassified Cupriavidus]|uniref:energy transducer TonB n=1 Tax=unclassified Cupriavidus TaxID=2640874 RepID=UPI00313E8FFF